MEQLPLPGPTNQSAGDPAPDAPDSVEHRQIVYRVLFDRPPTARRLAAVAGACRFDWNEMLDQQAQLHDATRMYGAKPPATPWLQAMPYAPVRYALKYRADAWRRSIQGEAGRPRFKRRGRDSVTIPQDVRIRDGKLYFPKTGWLAPQPGEFRVCGLRPRGSCGPERGPEHPASGTGATARRGAFAFSDPCDP